MGRRGPTVRVEIFVRGSRREGRRAPRKLGEEGGERRQLDPEVNGDERRLGVVIFQLAWPARRLEGR
jgi:hypothetical protein